MATENVPCDIEAAKKLRILVVKKHGKLKGYLHREFTSAVNAHCENLEKELEGETN